MRQGPNNRRPRGRHHNGNGNGNGNNNNTVNVQTSSSLGNRPRSAASLRHQTFESNCTEMRLRGNAWQVYEKYLALARDATSAGDRIAAENYLQHAEHYYRIIEAINDATAQEQRQRPHAQPNGGFGQQPETPTNYYGVEQPQTQQVQDLNNAGNAQPPQMIVESTRRQTPDPFITPDDQDESSVDNGQAQLVAQR